MDINEFILSGWDKCVAKSNDDGEQIVLPYTFTPPCINGVFGELYYWDTYFINVGLLIDKKYDLVRNNLKNFCYLIKEYGVLPNFSARRALINTQPPYFACMLEDYYDATLDDFALTEGLKCLKTEYSVWCENNRITSIGLSHYANNQKYFTPQDNKKFENYVIRRLKLSNQQNEDFGIQYRAEGESGWDFTPRFEHNAYNIAPVDLNCLLYKCECVLARFTKLNGEDSSYYESLAAKRKEAIQKYLYNEIDGVYYDYNYVEKRSTNIISASCFYPYWCDIANCDKGISKALQFLELDYGLSCLQKLPSDGNIYQWDYPNMWAPLVYHAVKGIAKFNLPKAITLAEKYVNTVNEEFIKTSCLWEKYDCTTGKKSSVNEYQEVKMLGWTAGVYRFCQEFLKTNKN